MSIFELVVVAFIAVSILVFVWRGGARNPESTGTLADKIAGMSGKLTQLSGRVGKVEAEMEELKAEAATTKDIQRVEAQMETLRAVMAEHHEVSKTTGRNVQRIYDVLLEQGLRK